MLTCTVQQCVCADEVMSSDTGRCRVSVCFKVKNLSLPSDAVCNAAFVDSHHTTLLLVCLGCPLHSPVYHTHTRRCCWSVYVVHYIHLSITRTHDAAAGLSTLSAPFTCLSHAHTRRCCWSVYVVHSIHLSITHTTLLPVCLHCPLHSPVYHTHT